MPFVLKTFEEFYYEIHGTVMTAYENCEFCAIVNTSIFLIIVDINVALHIRCAEKPTMKYCYICWINHNKRLV